MLIVLGEGKPMGAPALSLAYAWDGKAERPPLFFSQRSVLVGDLHAFALARNRQEFYLCANRNSIVRSDENGEENFFTHKTYVRDLALDDDDNVYFSEASGAGADGKIYRVRPAKGETGATAELVCTVFLRDVGYWAGNFAFGRAARGGLDENTLYLSSGNQVPAAIYRLTREGGEWGKPQPVFQAEMSIMGLVFTGPGEAYFVSGDQVFRLTDLKRVARVLTLPDVSRLRDVSLVPRAPAAKQDNP